ncbi:MAG: glycosyltransferase family 4 protein [Candidatus Marinimicrobia bacterium]|nr:glycosyltransferase family 4 protein [Candidatus Neomarinimicrobiota bacterium]
MHLALCTQQFGNYWSGLGTYSTLLARGLAKRGIKLTIISPGDPLADLDANYIKIRPSSWDPTHGGWFSLARAYRKQLRSIDADIVHFTDAREALGYSGKIPALGTLHDDYFARHHWVPWYYRKDYVDWVKRYLYYSFVSCAERRALRNLNMLIANSESTAHTISNRYVIDHERIQTIYIQPVLKAASNSGTTVSDDSPKTLLFVGGNIQRKGLPNVLRAMAMMKARNPKLILRVLGKNQNIEKMRELASRLGLKEQVRFDGWVHPSEMTNYYQKSSIFIMPSLMEGYGLVFLEAMSNGVPVIGGNVGGSRELIQDGKNGLLVDPLDVNDIAGSIETLLTDDELRNQLISGGQETISNLDPDAMIDATMDLYNRLLVRS